MHLTWVFRPQRTRVANGKQNITGWTGSQISWHGNRHSFCNLCDSILFEYNLIYDPIIYLFPSPLTLICCLFLNIHSFINSMGKNYIFCIIDYIHTLATGDMQWIIEISHKILLECHILIVRVWIFPFQLFINLKINHQPSLWFWHLISSWGKNSFRIFKFSFISAINFTCDTCIIDERPAPNPQSYPFK